MKWSISLASLLASGLALGGATAFASPCDEDDFSGTWCKREVPDTSPQEYTIEFTATTTGSGGVTGMVTSNGAKAGNLGVGKTGVASSKGIGKSSEKTKITGSKTVMLQAKDNGTPPCSPPSTEKQGNCAATSGSQYIPPC